MVFTSYDDFPNPVIFFLLQETEFITKKMGKKNTNYKS